jgi:hypothetical protein
MWGRAYDFHRHTGRMTQDPTMRMTNRAEVGFGVVGLTFLLIILLVMIGVFI